MYKIILMSLGNERLYPFKSLEEAKLGLKVFLPLNNRRKASVCSPGNSDSCASASTAALRKPSAVMLGDVSAATLCALSRPTLARAYSPHSRAGCAVLQPAPTRNNQLRIACRTM